MRYDELRRVLMPGDNMPMGDVVDRAVLKQPELANILEAIGKGGPDAFYKGDIAKAINLRTSRTTAVASPRKTWQATSR